MGAALLRCSLGGVGARPAGSGNLPLERPCCNPALSSLAPSLRQDPNFDLLLAAMFGDVHEFERQALEPSADVLAQAKAIGQQIAEVSGAAAAGLPAWTPCCMAGSWRQRRHTSPDT